MMFLGLVAKETQITPSEKQRADRSPRRDTRLHMVLAGKGYLTSGPGIPATAHYLSPEPQLASQVVMPDLLWKLDAEIPRGTVLRDTLLHDLINDV